MATGYGFQDTDPYMTTGTATDTTSLMTFEMSTIANQNSWAFILLLAQLLLWLQDRHKWVHFKPSTEMRGSHYENSVDGEPITSRN